MKTVMSFGAGVQSTAILTLAGEGAIPMPDYWVFSDTQYEGADTYTHLERCKEYLAKHARELHIVSGGNIREDAIEFGRLRGANGSRSRASIPLYVANNNGTAGSLPRQCTTIFKLEPIERYLRAKVMELKPRARAPVVPTVDVWVGISADEERRASAPGVWKTEAVEVGKDLFGEPVTKDLRKWVPVKWQVKSFPLLGYTLYPDRSRVVDDRFEYCAGWDREDALNWLSKVWPHPVPRSACICCPYRTNAEWRKMRDERPDEFASAVRFDREIRDAYDTGQRERGVDAGLPYVHRKLVPLDMVDLSEELNDRMGCGGLFSQEPDGICGV